MVCFSENTKETGKKDDTEMMIDWAKLAERLLPTPEMRAFDTATFKPCKEEVLVLILKLLKLVEALHRR